MCLQHHQGCSETPKCAYVIYGQPHIQTVHEKRIYGGETFPCPSCNYKAKHKESLKIHIEAVHKDSKYQCPKCEYTSSWRGSVRIHMKSVHEGLSLPCPHCDYKAPQKSNLQTHIQSVHEKQRQRYSCLQCDYSATKKSFVRRHSQMANKAWKGFNSLSSLWLYGRISKIASKTHKINS